MVGDGWEGGEGGLLHALRVDVGSLALQDQRKGAVL